MKIFVAGATGTLGRPVVGALRTRGHEVFGLTRSPEHGAALEARGVRAAIANALNPDQLCSAVTAAKPDVVVHLLTALPPGGPTRPSHLRATNELRITGTANLLGAAIAARARRLVAESFVGVYGSVSMARPLTEEDPLPPVADTPYKDTVLALRSLEDQLRAASAAGQIETVALRIGLLYGPGVPSTEQLVGRARARRLFAPRSLPGIGPLVHINDAASAIVAAIERPAPSPVYNIVDDEPTPLGGFLTALTRAIGARPPRHVPMWLLRLAAPTVAEVGTTKLLLSNAKARRELGWSLRYPTVQVGLTDLARIVGDTA